MLSLQAGRLANYLGFPGHGSSGKQSPSVQPADCHPDNASQRGPEANGFPPPPSQHPQKSAASGAAMSTTRTANVTKVQGQSVALERHTRRALRRRDKLRRVRDDVLLLRIKVDIERQKMVETQASYHESLTSFLEALHRATAMRSLKDAHTVSDELKVKLDVCAKVAQQQFDATKVLEHSLSKLETHQSTLEAATFESLERMLVEMSFVPSNNVLEGMVEADPVSNKFLTSNRSPSPHLHPYVAQYYDKLGDVGLLGEALANLEAEYKEATRDREFRLDHEQPLGLSNSDFERRFKVPMDETAQNLDLAILAVEDLKQLCLNVGIDLTADEKAVSEAASQDFAEDIEQFHMSLDSSTQDIDDPLQSQRQSEIALDAALFRSGHEGRSILITGEYDARSPPIGRFSDEDLHHIMEWKQKIVNEPPERPERPHTAPIRMLHHTAMGQFDRSDLSSADPEVALSTPATHIQASDVQMGLSDSHSTVNALRPASFPP